MDENRKPKAQPDEQKEVQTEGEKNTGRKEKREK